MATKCSQIRWEHFHWWGLNIHLNFLWSKLTKLNISLGPFLSMHHSKDLQQQNRLRHIPSQNLRAVENKGNIKNHD